jgi:hypothetical protein
MSIRGPVSHKNISNDDFGDQVQKVITSRGIEDVGEIRFSDSGYYSVLGTTTLTNDRTIALPNSSGTIALTSQIPTNSTYVDLTTTQTITAGKTFSTVLASTRAGQTNISSSGFYRNPATTALSGSNNYYYSYFTAPPTTGSTTGTASTILVAGAPASATNSYALQILNGQNSFPNGTVSIPSIIFDSNNSSGFYSSASNTINTAISGVNVFQVNSSGATVNGDLYTNVIRSRTSTQINFYPAVNDSTPSGSLTCLFSPSSTSWDVGASVSLHLGDSNHKIQSIYGSGMYFSDTDSIFLSTTAGLYNFSDNGTTTYMTYGTTTADPIGSNTYGLSFGSGASGSSLNIYSSVSHTVKIGRNNDGDAIRLYRNNPSVNVVGSISLTAIGTTYNTTSDRRLKENIVEKKDSLDIVKQLKVYDYNFKADDKKTKCTGLLADEIKILIPEIVSGEEDKKDEYGNIEPLMVDYSKFIPFLINAIQELSDKVDELKK